jgi:hypothetical protein
MRAAGGVQIWSDARFEALPEAKRVQLFRDFRAVLKEVEAYHRNAAAKEAARAEGERTPLVRPPTS